MKNEGYKYCFGNFAFMTGKLHI